MDYRLPDSSVHGISQERMLGWVSIFLLQGIFPTPGSNLHLLLCRRILYLSHWGTFRFFLLPDSSGNAVLN